MAPRNGDCHLGSPCRAIGFGFARTVHSGMYIYIASTSFLQLRSSRLLFFDVGDRLFDPRNKGVRLSQGVLRQLEFRDQDAVLVDNDQPITLLHSDTLFDRGQRILWIVGMIEFSALLTLWELSGLRCYGHAPISSQPSSAQAQANQKKSSTIVSNRY